MEQAKRLYDDLINGYNSMIRPVVSDNVHWKEALCLTSRRIGQQLGPVGRQNGFTIVAADRCGE